MKIRCSIITATALLIVLSLSNNSFAGDSTTYYWSSYESDLFDTYSNPENLKEFEATLLRIINKSDTSGRKPPPGILAEYGYILYRRGDANAAIQYFQREAGQWPESRMFMNRVIAHVRQGAAS